MDIAQRVRAQYERYPYPPISSWALPAGTQAGSVAFERGLALVAKPGVITDSRTRSHEGIRVLVAGGGTLEPLVVAQAHPRAREVTIVDLSAHSMQRARRRVGWFRVQNGLRMTRARVPKLNWVVEDLNLWSAGEFDYIVASNVLHHTPDPAALLARLATWLRPGGLLRLVTYPKLSRLWLREVGHWLRWHGVSQSTPHVKQRARRAIARLPAEHPIRLCFEHHRESSTSAGIVDAFLHACERPLSPIEWGHAAAKAGLELLGEDQHALSRSDFLDHLVPACNALDVWSKLEVLDCTLELSTNPVLWFMKSSTVTCRHEGSPSAPRSLGDAHWIVPERLDSTRSRATSSLVVSPPRDACLLTLALSADEIWARRPRRVRLPSRLYWELGEGLHRAADLLAQADVDIAQLIEALRAEVGTHFSADGTRALPDFAASDYDTAALLAAPEPWCESHWRRLDELAQGTCRMKVCDRELPAGSLEQQAQWLQARYGTVMPAVELELVWSSTFP